MTCQEFESILHLYLDGEFQPEERLTAEEHLSACAPCAQRVRDENRMRLSLRRAARQAVENTRAPDALRARLQVNLHQEHRRVVRASWLRMGTAALVLVAVSGSAWAMFRPAHGQRYMEAAVRRHTSRLPVEVAGGSHEVVEAWFDGKLEHRVNLPRLNDVRLSGGRISNVTDRPAAYISYERGGGAQGAPSRRIGLFVFDDAQGEVEAPSLPAVQVGSSLGYNVAVWREGEIVYELVSDLDEMDIRRMVSEPSAHPVAAPVGPQAAPPNVRPALLQP